MSSGDPKAWRVMRKTASFGPSGLFIDDICLARKIEGKYVRHFTQNASLKKILQLLDDGRTADAIFLANFASCSLDARKLTRANFNLNEARDARGRWTLGSDDVSSPTIEQVQYRGHFHNLVVDDLIRGLNAHGANAIAHVEVSGINGVIAIPDGASLPSGWKTPYFIEVKTGDDPSFTPNQMQVYPLICIGGHATSFDPRISDLGLRPGAPLPPMDIMVVHTLGPGQPMSFINYCEVVGLRARK